MKKIGFITIGQAPRTDVTDDMKEILGSEYQIIELGALDNLTLKEILKLAPCKGSKPLITRLLDGSHVTIGEREIHNLMQKKVDMLNNIHDIEKIIIICTSNFSERFISSKSIFYSGDILMDYINSKVDSNKMLILLPMESQILEFSNVLGKKFDYGVLNPYIPYNKKIEISSKYDLIYLNCMGYNIEIKNKLEWETGKQVIIPREILCKFITT